jgi:hypothetical protein
MYIWEDFSMLYNQIQRKFIESCESSTTSNEMVNSIEYLSILLFLCLSIIRHRIQLFNSLRKFQDVLNLDILLKGSPILNVEENTEIFEVEGRPE